MLATLSRQLDSDRAKVRRGRRVDWLRIWPFIGLHLACLAVIWVGVSPVAVAVALALSLIHI